MIKGPPPKFHGTRDNLSWLLASGTGTPVPYHPPSQYWPLQLALLAVLLAAAGAALISGWRSTRTRRV